MTERLFDSNGHTYSFDATVVSCTAIDGSFEVELDKTAFYPEGGGQRADSGTIDGEKVFDVTESKRKILHCVGRAFNVGETVHGELDRQLRFGRMQNHTGEHLVCGLAHSLFGCENTGFHMGTLGVTTDLSKPLSEAEVAKIELLANEAVYKNVDVFCEYPSACELEKMHYRSKLDLTENVRIVTIDGYDVCACCAPHVQKTGEIGVVKILDSIHYKGGTRLLMKCGSDAVEDYVERCRQIRAVSEMLCAKQNEIALAVERLRDENSSLKFEIERLHRQALDKYIDRIKNSNTNACIFAGELSFDELREIVNAGVEKCGGVFAAFGSSDGAYRYVLGSRAVDLTHFVKDFNTALNGRGGGKTNMVQGSVAAEKKIIVSFLQAEEQ